MEPRWRARACALVVAASLAPSGCRHGMNAVSGSLPTALPAARPADFAFRFSRTGGMLDDSEALDCDAQRCTHRRHSNGRGQEDTRPASAAQLDAVYAALRDARFDRMRPEPHEMVYDAASRSLWMRAGGHETTLAEGAREGVAQADATRFQSVVDAVQALSRALFPEPMPGEPVPPGAAPTPAASPSPAPQ